MKIIQEPIKGILKANTTTVTFGKKVREGFFKQLQAYHNGTDASVSIEIEINDVSGTPIVKKQPIENLRSRDGSYFSNMPLDGMAGNNLDIVITTSKAVTTDTHFSVVFDIEQNQSNC